MLVVLLPLLLTGAIASVFLSRTDDDPILLSEVPDESNPKQLQESELRTSPRGAILESSTSGGRGLDEILVCLCKNFVKTQGFSGHDLKYNVCGDLLCEVAYRQPELFGCTSWEVHAIGGLGDCLYRNTPFCHNWIPNPLSPDDVKSYMERLKQCGHVASAEMNLLVVPLEQ